MSDSATSRLTRREAKSLPFSLDVSLLVFTQRYFVFCVSCSFFFLRPRRNDWKLSSLVRNSMGGVGKTLAAVQDRLHVTTQDKHTWGVRR